MENLAGGYESMAPNHILTNHSDVLANDIKSLVEDVLDPEQIMKQNKELLKLIRKRCSWNEIGKALGKLGFERNRGGKENKYEKTIMNEEGESQKLGYVIPTAHGPQKKLPNMQMLNKMCYLLQIEPEELAIALKMKLSKLGFWQSVA